MTLFKWSDLVLDLYGNMLQVIVVCNSSDLA